MSEWHALLFLTSLLLPPPLYFFLGQNYSENVFEFVNHFDSPSFPDICWKIYSLPKKLFFQIQPAPTISRPAKVCLDGSEALTALGTQHGWSRGRVCQEDKPQPLSRQWWALKSSDPPLLRLNRESGSNRGHHTEGVPHQVVASRYDGSAWSFGSLGKTLHSKPGLWRLSGCIMAAWSCLLSRLQKI